MTDVTDVAVFDTSGSDTLNRDIEALKNGQVNIFSSMPTKTFEEKLGTLEFLTNSTPLDEMMGKAIQLTHYIIQPIEMPDQETGELRSVPRVILIDADGKAYHAISTGVYSSLKNISALAGMPATWEGPVTVTPNKEKSPKGTVYTLKVGGPRK